MAPHGDGHGFGEGVQRGFALDDAVAFRKMMLEIYSYRCAISGAVHGPDSADDKLDVFLFQPLGHEGTLRPGNAIVVETEKAEFLHRGLVQIGDDFLIYLPDPVRRELGTDLAERQGRPLFLPDNPSLWPERAMLAYRRQVFRPV